MKEKHITGCDGGGDEKVGMFNVRVLCVCVCVCNHNYDMIKWMIINKRK